MEREDQQQRRRNQALDAWDYQRLFAPFHIAWDEGDLTPAFEANQAYAIALQDLALAEMLTIWGHREVLVTFSSNHVGVNGRPAVGEPAWVVIVAGVRDPDKQPINQLLNGVPPGSGAVVQALIHARSGQILIGRAVPVSFGG